MRKILIIFLVNLILLTTSILAYQTCDGEYSPYPVKCIGGGGSSYTADSGGNPSVQSGNYSLIEIIWVIAGILVIIYFAKKIFFRRHRR